MMPMVFVFCIWAAVSAIAEIYLWIREKGKLVAIPIAAGLVTNLALNAILLPIWGLQGAVVATLCSHGVVMMGVWWAMDRC